jgi:hypothetical protein
LLKRPGLPNPQHDYSKNHKAKTIWAAAFKALFNDNCIDELHGDNSNKGNQDKDELPDNKANKDLCSLLSMVGYLKE